ncbi:MAG: hypothetical protein F6J87_17460 [Spirulina sp. SIO3F2]|nr:hypothetical protein [Spirulina sp. SIO3F2]
MVAAIAGTTPLNAEPLRVIVFAIAGHQLALPMKAVFKISPCPPQADQAVDLLDLEGQAVRLLDLASRLNPNHQQQRRFLLLIQTQLDGLYGIPLAELPSMMGLSVPTIQALPSTTQAQPLGQVCRYVSLQPQESGPATLVFLLDLGLLLGET